MDDKMAKVRMYVTMYTALWNTAEEMEPGYERDLYTARMRKYYRKIMRLRRKMREENEKTKRGDKNDKKILIVRWP